MEEIIHLFSFDMVNTYVSVCVLVIYALCPADLKVEIHSICFVHLCLHLCIHKLTLLKMYPKLADLLMWYIFCYEEKM